MGNKTIEKQSQEVLKIPKGSTQEELNRLQSELEKAQTPEQKKTIRNEMLSIRRSVNRTRQYSDISGHKLAEGKNSLDDISAADLMRLDKEVSKEKRGEFLSKSFLYKQTTDKEGNILQEATDGKGLKSSDTLFVDFGNNKSAEGKLGAGDMLPIEVQVVEIIDLNGKSRIGKRSVVGNKVGYYDENGYIPIYNSYSIRIPSPEATKAYLTSSDPEIVLSTDMKSEDTAKDAFIEISERYDRIGAGSPWELAERQKFQKEATMLAKEMEEIYGVPWQVTYAQAVLESGWGRSAPGNNYFGIKGHGQVQSTQEEVNGQRITINASFRQYSSMRSSFEDHALVLKRQWPQAFTTKDPVEFTKLLVQSPPKYATASNYTDEISKIIAGYDRLQNAKPASLELTGITTQPDTLISLGEKMMGVPYVGGASSDRSVDCSGFVSKLMRETGVASEGFRTTAAGLKRYTQDVGIHEARRGDLMFFWGPHMYSKEPTYNHIAIVLGTPNNGMVKVLDASGSSSGEGKVAIRTIKLEDKHSFGRPGFYNS